MRAFKAILAAMIACLPVDVLALLIFFIVAASATPQIAASTTGAGTQTVTATSVANLNWWISGFIASCGGATAAGVNNGSLTGLLGGSVNFVIGGPTGIGTQGFPVAITFPTPIPNVAGTNVVLNVPSPGSGNTVCSGTIFGELR